MITTRALPLILLLSLLLSSPSLALKERSFALELEYGVSINYPLIANDVGQDVYGKVLYMNPISLTGIWTAYDKFNLGLSYAVSGWSKKDYFSVDSVVCRDPMIRIESITPFIDLAPFLFENGGKRGITEGFFIETGPAFIRAVESYDSNGSDHSFETSGAFIEVRGGFRTINEAPLSFVFRTKVLIPLSRDNEVSETGFSLNGLSIFSIHAGFCLTI